MKAVLLAKENGDAKFTMEFTAEEFENGKVEAYKANKDQFQIDGFRKGKAPRSIIEKRYGKDIFVEEAINNMLQTGYPQALKDLELDVIDQPRMEFGKVEDGEPVTMTVTVAIYPEVEVKDYKGVEIENIDDVVTDEELETELKNMQKKNARIMTVERPVKDGDHIVLDYKGFVGDEQFEGGTAESYPLVIGSGSFIPGFEEQLVGAEIDKEVEVKVTFPEEYHSADLAGKEAVFKCVVHEVKEEELPELDDEFAKDVSEFDTMDELKADIKNNMSESKAAWAKNQLKERALDAVCDKNDIEVPDVMIVDELDQMVKEMNMQLSQAGLNFEQYLGYMGKEMKDFNEEMRPEAEKKVKARMVVTAVAEAEKLEATEDEITAELQMIAAQYGLELDKMMEMLNDDYKDMVAKDVKVRKAIDLIFDNAVIK